MPESMATVSLRPAPGTSTTSGFAGRRFALHAQHVEQRVGTPTSSASAMRWPPRSAQRTSSVNRSALSACRACTSAARGQRVERRQGAGLGRLPSHALGEALRGEELAHARLAGSPDPLLDRHASEGAPPRDRKPRQRDHYGKDDDACFTRKPPCSRSRAARPRWAAACAARTRSCATRNQALRKGISPDRRSTSPSVWLASCTPRVH